MSRRMGQGASDDGPESVAKKYENIADFFRLFHPLFYDVNHVNLGGTNDFLMHSPIVQFFVHGTPAMDADSATDSFMWVISGLHIHVNSAYVQ